MRDYGFGNFLYQLRIDKKLSQAEVGRLVGVTNKAVSKWENGAAKPRPELLCRLAALYEVSVEELLAGRRTESHEELEALKADLRRMKCRVARCAAWAYAVLLSFPLLVLMFVGFVMGAGIPDEVVGPLGAMLLFAVLVSSLTCTVVFSSAFRKNPPDIRSVMTEEERARTGQRLSMAAGLGGMACCLAVLIVCVGVEWFRTATVFLLLGGVFTVAYAILVYSRRLRRLLKLKRPPRGEGRGRRIPFYALLCGLGGLCCQLFSVFVRFVVFLEGRPESLTDDAYEFLYLHLLLLPSGLGLVLYGVFVWQLIRNRRRK